MTADQITLFALFGAVFGLLLWGRWRYDLVAFGALVAGLLLGVVPAEAAWSGFGHPATVIVALVLVVSAGLVRSGAVVAITRRLVDAGRGIGGHVAVMGALGAGLSAFMNNVAALALLMPVDVQAARKAGRAPGLTLMPLSFATILGGMVTLIGTPPNIIVASFREEALGAPFGMFDFAPVGGVTALAGLAFVVLAGRHLIPQRDSAEPKGETSRYMAELVVAGSARILGQRLSALYPEADRSGVAILGLSRGGRRLFGTAAGAELAEGDILVLEGTADAIDEFRAALALDYASGGRGDLPRAETEGLAVIEVVVPEGARIAGRSAATVGLAWRRRTVLVGISRQGRRIRRALRREMVRPGDILLLLVPEEEAEAVVDWLGCLPLAGRGLAVTQDHKTWLAAGLFAAAVAAASLGFADLPVALGAVVVAYALFRIVPLSELYGAIEWPVVVLLGSMIPLGAALESSGGAELIAGWLVEATAGTAPWLALTLLMAVTMTLSDVLNNTATAIVAAPVAVGMAERLGVSPDPFLMAVAVAASCAFLTPIGHKNNTLVLGPGGYRFGDYWRMGLPLEVLVVAVSVPAILLVWPL